MEPAQIDPQDGDDIVIGRSADFVREAPKHQPSKKLKYKAKGYRIEISDDGKNWRLKRYYKNACDMRQAYSHRGAGDHSWKPDYHFRMIYPDGRIVQNRRRG